jgi:hypothetical protein
VGTLGGSQVAVQYIIDTDTSPEELFIIFLSTIRESIPNLLRITLLVGTQIITAQEIAHLPNGSYITIMNQHILEHPATGWWLSIEIDGSLCLRNIPNQKELNLGRLDQLISGRIYEKRYTVAKGPIISRHGVRSITVEVETFLRISPLTSQALIELMLNRRVAAAVFGESVPSLA